MIKNLTKRDLQRLRNQIILNSLFLDDYSNTFDITEKDCCYFFDGYVDYLVELADSEKFNYSDIGDVFNKYDNIDNLYNFYLDTQA